MKPNPRANHRSLFAPTFVFTRALAVVILFSALACILRGLRPQTSPARGEVEETAPATPDPAKRRRPATRDARGSFAAAINPAAGKKEQRGTDHPPAPDAFAVATAILDPALREETLSRLCYQQAESDPRRALELAIEHGLEGAAGAVIGNLAQQWAAADLRATLAWVKDQPASAIREDLVARVGYVWSLADPAAAADFVAAETPAGEAQVEAAISVLHQWSRRDPAAARAWGDCFPEGELRERALHEVGDPPPPDE